MTNKEKIKAQLELDVKQQINVHDGITGLHLFIYGNFKNVRGDVFKLSGDITGLSGTVSSGLFGDVTYLSGDITGIEGNIEDIIDILREE